MPLPKQLRRLDPYAETAIEILGFDPRRRRRRPRNNNGGNQTPAPKPATNGTLFDNEQFNYLLSQFDNDMQLVKPNEFLPQMRAHLINL